MVFKGPSPALPKGEGDASASHASTQHATGQPQAQNHAAQMELSQVRVTPAKPVVMAATAAKADVKKMLGTSADAPACRQCGNITLRNGTCYMCPNCGTTTGCS